MFLLTHWRLVGVALLCVALGVQQIRLSAAKSEISDLRLSIAQGVADAERVTREAVEAARLKERADRDRLVAAADKAAADARLEANSARKRLTDLNKRIQELSDADPSIDAWRVAPLPEPIRLLIGSGDKDGSG